MKIHGIELVDYRGIANKKITFQDTGITVVSGPNQSGKSSVIEAIGLVLNEQATSKKQKVRRVLKRDSDRPATVAIDVTIGPERLHLEKKFGAGRGSETVLTFPAGTKEALTGSPAHNYVQQLLAEHEDTALFEALRFLQEEELDSFQLTTQQSALQEALDAAANRHHEGDEADLLNAVDTEFAKYFTPTGRENKNFTTQREQVDKLAKRVESVQDQVARVKEESETVEQLVRDTQQLEKQFEVSSTEMAAAQRIVEKQSEAVAKLQSLTAKKDTISQQINAVQLVIKAETEKQQRIEKLRERKTRLEDELAQFVPLSEEELSHRRKELALKEKELQRESDLTAAAQVLERKEHLEKQLSKLEKYRTQIIAVEEQLGESSYDPDIYQHTWDLFERISQLAAARTLAATSARIEPLNDQVLVQGEKITAETSLQISEETTIEVPEAVKIVLSPGEEAAQLHAEHNELTQQFDNSIAKLEVTNWEEAEKQKAEWEVQQEKLNQLEVEYRAYVQQGTIAELTRELATCEETLDTYGEKIVQEAQQSGLELSSEADLQAKRTELTRMQSDLQEEEHNASVLKERRSANLAALSDISTELKTLDVDVSALHNNEEHYSKLKLSETELTKRLKLLKEDLESTEEAQKNFEQLQETTAQLKEQLATSEQETIRAKAQLEVRLSEGYAGQLQEAQREYDVAKSELDDVEKHAAAIALLRETLEVARSESAQHYQQPYLRTLQKLGQKVWGESFQVTIDENLQITSAITKTGANPIAFEDLSAGTKEQLAVLSRLACFYLVDKGAVPVILDDVLGYSDPERLDLMVETLALVAGSQTNEADGPVKNGGQIFIFTCAPERFADIPARREKM